MACRMWASCRTRLDESTESRGYIRIYLVVQAHESHTRLEVGKPTHVDRTPSSISASGGPSMILESSSKAFTFVFSWSFLDKFLKMICMTESEIVDRSRGSATWEIGEMARELPNPENAVPKPVPKPELFDIAAGVPH